MFKKGRLTSFTKEMMSAEDEERKPVRFPLYSEIAPAIFAGSLRYVDAVSVSTA